MTEPTPELLEAGRLLFAQECRFTMAVAKLGQLPPLGLPEIAFCGRSNVGKSSLVNALTGRGTLARTSNTPGRTQQLIFFELGARLTLVDLPGYGFARVSKSMVESWTRLLKGYLKGRVTLRRACVLIDGRHGLKPGDEDIMGMLDQAAVPYQIVLTKIDKVRRAELDQRLSDTTVALKSHPAAFPEIMVTSARDGTGIAELRAALSTLAEPIAA